MTSPSEQPAAVTDASADRAPDASPDPALGTSPDRAPGSTAPSPEAPSPEARSGNPAARLQFDDPLSLRSADDTDSGWGERPASGDGTGGGSAADLARFLDEKPPHHL